MTYALRTNDLAVDYPRLVHDVLRRGRDVSPRGLRTMELTDVVIELSDPTRCVPVGVGRQLNLAIGAAEAAQLVAGVSSADLMVDIAPNFKRFVRNHRLHGAYGPRLRNQLPRVVSALAEDPDTRQAVATIARPYDLMDAQVSGDMPCTRELQFTVRDEQLCLTVNMRSNDAVWGLSYDAFQFCALQSAVAYALGRPLGAYVHRATSFHVYVDRDEEVLSRLHDYDGAPHPPLPFPSVAGHITPRSADLALRRWYDARRLTEVAIHGTADHWYGHPLEWYQNRLAPHVHALGATCATCSYVLPVEEMAINGPNCLDCTRDRAIGLSEMATARERLRRSVVGYDC